MTWDFINTTATNVLPMWNLDWSKTFAWIQIHGFTNGRTILDTTNIFATSQ